MRRDDKHIRVDAYHPGTVDPQFKNDLPVLKRSVGHISQVLKERAHYRTAVPEGMNQPPRIIQIPSDPSASILKGRKPAFFGHADKFTHGTVPAGEFIQTLMNRSLPDQCVPAVQAVLETKFMHQR